MLNYAELCNFMQVMLKTYAKVGFGPFVLGNHCIQLLRRLTCWIILITSGRDFIQILFKLRAQFLSRRGLGLGLWVFLVIFFLQAVHNLSVRRGRAQTNGGSPIWRTGHGSGWCHIYTLNTIVWRRRVSHEPCGPQRDNYIRI